MNKTIKRLLIFTTMAMLAFIGWIAAGPYLAMHGIHQAIEKKDIQQLGRHVDYPALRTNIKAQVENRIAHEINQRFGDQAGSMNPGVAGMLSDNAVDAMTSPAGIAILLQGSSLAQHAAGSIDPQRGSTTTPPPYDPLKDAKTGFRSPSRFVATVHSAKGNPVDFVFERRGLRWRLTNIILP